jgi:argininosuccinate lyase
MVAYCEKAGVELDELSDVQLAEVSPSLTPDVRAVLSVAGALAARRTRGGTAPERVAEQLTALRTLVGEHRAWAASSPVAGVL